MWDHLPQGVLSKLVKSQGFYRFFKEIIALQAFSACICKQCHRRRKMWDHLPQGVLSKLVKSQGFYRFFKEIIALQA